MTVSIIECPSCDTMLLADTIQCPTCRHVFDESLLNRTHDATPPGSSPSEITNEDRCPGCGELVRSGLVRCWKCGTFMRDDIADSYRQMTALERPVIHSAERGDDSAEFETLDSQDAEIDEVTFAEIPDAAAIEDVTEESDDKIDFELSEEIVPLEAVDDEVSETFDSEDDFDVDPQYALQEGDDGSDSYQLSGQPVPEQPAAAAKDDANPTMNDETAPQETDESVTEEIDEQQQASTDGETAEGEQTSDAGADEEPQEEAHSVATGGDVLLDVALKEEEERQTRRSTNGTRRTQRQLPPSGVQVFCPHGHRIVVQEKHRGKMGRCPKCRCAFIVPEQQWPPQPAKPPEPAQDDATIEVAEGVETAAEQPLGDFSHWMNDIHVHAVNPAKLKLKPESLLKAFEPMDFGFGPQGLLAVALLKKGGSAKKMAAARDTLLTELADGTSNEELSVATQQLYDVDALQQLRIVQPVAADYESMFAGVPIFGEHRIAVLFPKLDDDADPRYASFSLSEFREFSSKLAEQFGIADFGFESEIPLTDTFSELKCHYSDETLRVLESVEWYENDPGFELQLIGRCCQECELVVSEDSRKKEKLGGAAGRGIAKAKCPKCKKKFGKISLFTLEQPPESDEAADDSDETTTDSEAVGDEQPAGEPHAEETSET